MSGTSITSAGDIFSFSIRKKRKIIKMEDYGFYDWEVSDREWFLNTLQWVDDPFRYEFYGRTIDEDPKYSHLRYLHDR